MFKYKIEKWYNFFIKYSVFLSQKHFKNVMLYIAQLTRAVEYVECISAEV